MDMASSQPKPRYPGKILVIDDDEDIRNIYNDFLTQKGYVVDLAKDGQEGLQKILEGGYDLILLDIMMPKIDGLGILKALKDKAPGSNVYTGNIVVLSVLNQPYIIEQAMALGAKGYLNKSSVNPDEAMRAIEGFLDKESDI